MAKIRAGFVSNSSSSSFVLLKSKLTEQQIEDVRAWVELHNKCASDGYINETESAFFGEKDYHIEQISTIDDIFKHAEWEY